MGKSLRVLDGGSWKTIEAPYIMHDDAWEKVFKVHVLNGGVWKESHKTAYTKYSVGTGGQTETQSDGSWTVPAKTRYIKVKIWGSGASGGGGGDTGYLASSVTQYRYRVTGASSSTGHSHPAGGEGGHGANAEVVLETKPGVTFSWTGLNAAVPVGGTGARDMILGTSSVLREYNDYYTVGVNPHQGIYTPVNQNYRYDPGSVIQGSESNPTETFGTYGFFKVPDTDSSINALKIGSTATPNAWAREGQDATDIVFTGDSPTTGDPYIITAGGGKKGYGGRHIVTAASKSGSQHYYTISSPTGSNWAHDKFSGTSTPYDDYDSDWGGWKRYGVATATGNGNSFVSTTLTTGGGMTGGAGYSGPTLYSDGWNYGGNGSPGTKGKLIIETYQ